MNAWVEREWQRQREQALKRRGLIDALAQEFSITDRDELSAVIGEAREAYEGALWPSVGRWNERAADALEALDEPLWETVTLLQELGWRIAEELARPGETAAEAEDRLHGLVNALALVGHAARRVPRLRAGRGRKSYAPLRALTEPLVRYWTQTLDRKFTQNHHLWHPGPGGKILPPTVPSRFVHAVVEFLAPDEVKGLKTILREFTTYGK